MIDCMYSKDGIMCNYKDNLGFCCLIPEYIESHFPLGVIPIVLCSHRKIRKGQIIKED
ncbi:hypothetical protein LCGC14_2769780 [marine sediment metagenome]|uniref:Uncharacterized protein n=1 Tax=marine sediment metagenome TaxID=412755 RepID=A0A0F8VA10_9ZZZZ